MPVSVGEEGPWGHSDIFREPTDPEMIAYLGRKRESLQNEVRWMGLYTLGCMFISFAFARVGSRWPRAQVTKTYGVPRRVPYVAQDTTPPRTNFQICFAAKAMTVPKMAGLEPSRREHSQKA